LRSHTILKGRTIGAIGTWLSQAAAVNANEDARFLFFVHFMKLLWWQMSEFKLKKTFLVLQVVLQLEGAPDSPLVRIARLVLQHVINLGSQDLNNDMQDWYCNM
jgi:hypothetical protein